MVLLLLLPIFEWVTLTDSVFELLLLLFKGVDAVSEVRSSESFELVFVLFLLLLVSTGIWGICIGDNGCVRPTVFVFFVGIISTTTSSISLSRVIFRISSSMSIKTWSFTTTDSGAGVEFRLNGLGLEVTRRFLEHMNASFLDEVVNLENIIWPCGRQTMWVQSLRANQIPIWYQWNKKRCVAWIRTMLWPVDEPKTFPRWNSAVPNNQWCTSIVIIFTKQYSTADLRNEENRQDKRKINSAFISKLFWRSMLRNCLVDCRIFLFSNGSRILAGYGRSRQYALCSW